MPQQVCFDLWESGAYLIVSIYEQVVYISFLDNP